MKKGLILVLLLAVMVTCLSACGAEKTIPEKTVEWAIEDFIKGQYGSLENAPQYSYVVNHSPDSSTKSDTIHVDLTLNDPHYTAVSAYDATYVYDKGSELWTLQRGGDWSSLKTTNMNISSDSQIWKDVWENTVNDSDYSSLEALFSTFDEEKSNEIIKRNYEIESGELFWAFHQTPISGSFYVVGNQEDAERLLEQILPELMLSKSDSSSLETRLVNTIEGNNFKVYVLDGTFKMKATDYLPAMQHKVFYYLTRIDNNVFTTSVSLYDDNQSEMELFRTGLKDLGFLIPELW